MGVADYRFARVNKPPTRRAAVVALLQKLPLICPLAIVIGSLLMIGITLYCDWQ